MSDIKLHIYYKIVNKPWGGANQFLKALSNYFRQKGCYVESPYEADVILANSHHFFGNAGSLKFIRKIRNKNNSIIIQRVDGPIFCVRGRDSKLDRIIFDFNRYVADGTIFQSRWSQNQSYLKGMKHNNFETTINNAADPNIFHPKEEKKIVSNSDEKIKIIATSWSKNKRKGFDVYKFLDENLDFNRFEMTFVGNSPITFRNINHIPPQPSEKLADLLRDHDIFITASINDPCSNSLIEALYCGLPSLVINSGGHPEIIGNGGLMFEGTDDVLTTIDKLVKNLNQYRKAIDISHIDKVGRDYYNFCKNVYESVQRGEYKPKKFSLITYWRLRFRIFMRGRFADN